MKKNSQKIKVTGMAAEDNSMHFGDCPKAKKSKTSDMEIEADTKKEEQQQNTTAGWARLPTLVLTDIFDKLSHQDRMNASTVCKHWRQNSFQSKWWPRITFIVDPSDLDRSRFLTGTFGTRVLHATVRFNTLSYESMEEFVSLLRTLSENNHLKSLLFEPTHCHFEAFSRQDIKNTRVQYLLRVIKESIRILLPYLNKFSIGCVEDLLYSVPDFLKELARKDPKNITHLGIASLKDEPDTYRAAIVDPDLISPFENLKIFSIDYDNLSDRLLKSLNEANGLERLVVHLHSIKSGHPGTSNFAWATFKSRHPNCEFRLNVIHAFKVIDVLHDEVLRAEMPLSHLRVFFCESMNTAVLEFLSRYFHETVQSVAWVDSISDSDSRWIFAQSIYDESPDPLIMISWLCRRVNEIVLYGYKYWEENLVAIARLRGTQLARLEITEEDILRPNPRLPHESAAREIPISIKKPWAPVSKNELHPVIHNPLAGDSDEYILPIVLGDLH